MTVLGVAAVLLLAARADAIGAGVWKDPGHYVSDDSLAGLRFVAEFPEKKLTMIGTDDGAKWWMLHGETGMSDEVKRVTFDFSPKGGPADFTAIWLADAAKDYLMWPDGNSWESASPTTAAFAATIVETGHGLFIDPEHFVPGSFAGVRVIAEVPQHTLHMVGSDDGKTWWYLQGICHDVTDNNKPMFRFDFSPKGGPSDLTASWDHKTKIAFPDGNTWFKPPFKASAALLAAAPEASSRAETSSVSMLPLALLLAVATLAWMAVRKGRALCREAF